jgi:hypothetical protein
VNGEGMRVLPRKLPVAMPGIAFSGYRSLISRSPERQASLTVAAGERKG